MATVVREGLHTLDATVLARRVAARKVRAVEVVEQYLARISRENRRLNALVLVDEEGARRRAEALDRRIRRGARVGPLCGVPFTVKDVIETAGLRTTAGAEALASHVPARNAPAVQRLLDADAILVGKTNTPAFSADIQCSSPLLGVANNPWDPTRTSGGSSGGGAAALASHLTALELGSDHGGSIRIPAAFCGVVGLKPTAGVVPSRGHLHPVPGAQERDLSIICLGPLGRSVADVRLAYHVLTGTHPRRRGKAPRVFALLRRVPGLPVDDDVARALGDAVSTLIRAGHVVDEVTLPEELWGRAWAAWQTLIHDDIMGPWNALGRAWMGTVAPQLRTQMLQSAQRARETQRQVAAALDGMLAQRDAILMPATLTTAFTHRPMGTPVEVGGERCDYWLSAAATTSLASLTGHPALVLPVGFSREGLPLSVQLVGSRDGDASLLNFASDVEALHVRHPVNWER
ncbi:MAG: amidase [Myxococcota bacterium]